MCEVTYSTRDLCLLGLGHNGPKSTTEFFLVLETATQCCEICFWGPSEYTTSLIHIMPGRVERPLQEADAEQGSQVVPEPKL